MRRKIRFLLLGAAASCLLSCASVAPRPALTVELFDSTAKSPVEPEPGTALLPYLAPVAPDARIAASAPEAAPKPGYEVSLPVIHAAPRALPRGSALSLPTAPALKKAPPSTSAGKPAAPAPAAPASAPAARQAAPASSQLQPAAAASAAPAGTAGPGTAGATAGPGTAGAHAATNGSYGRLREIYARQGDEVQIGLDGTGFLFLGFPDKTPQGDGMSFKGKENRNNKTWFTFQPLKLGTYDLDFLRQDNSTGQSSKETVRVHVVSDQEFSLATSQQQGPDQSGEGQVEQGDAAFAERLSGLGANEAAIAELLKGYKDGNPALNDHIAALYMRTGAYDAAGKYYQKNLSPQSAFTTSAVLGMVHIAIAQKDQQGFMTYLKQFLAVKAPAMEETLIQAARMEKEKGESGVALDLAAEYAARYPEGKWRDEAAFLMAQIREADSRYRDIARARSLYLEIVQSYPESTFASPARERLLYLERHFFEVR